ncbi:hypothetical protein FRX31_023244 [Thalictrum thalictroides]|uniref:Uncharacterized protein n=1 Tax=Thalictrum thalictroides TaxID=46969 RepID=A0A7J6VPY8_THATH|nr:hypothetical protein FRX31_023244 [Thalictrum thalictroides]
MAIFSAFFSWFASSGRVSSSSEKNISNQKINAVQSRKPAKTRSSSSAPILVSYFPTGSSLSRL